MSIEDTLHDFTLNLDPCFIPETVPCALAKQKCFLLLLGFVFSLCGLWYFEVLIRLSGHSLCFSV